MSDDLQWRFAAARTDADATALADPATLRHTGTRRTRVKAGLSVAAAFVAVALVAAGSDRLLFTSAPEIGTEPPPPATLSTRPPEPTPPPEPTRPPEPTDPAEPTPPTDTGTAEPDAACSAKPAACYPPRAQWHLERLPAPCAKTTHASDASIVTRVAEQMLDDSGSGSSATTYGRTITRYRDGGAAAYLAELRAAVGGCTSVRRDGTLVRYKRVGSVRGGDESLLLSRTFRSETLGGGTVERTFLIAVVRVGDVVAVVYDYGWEGAPVGRRQFDKFVAVAVAKARAA